jgi:hypothetical protein
MDKQSFDLLMRYIDTRIDDETDCLLSTGRSVESIEMQEELEERLVRNTER